jgi:hypothetical protein
MRELIGVSLLTDIASLNKNEQKKLQKYDNLYDRLRKKKNELEMLLTQRKFAVHFESVSKASTKSVSFVI